jgi:hypothetical protein
MALNNLETKSESDKSNEPVVHRYVDPFLRNMEINKFVLTKHEQKIKRQRKYFSPRSSDGATRIQRLCKNSLRPLTTENSSCKLDSSFQLFSPKTEQTQQSAQDRMIHESFKHRNYLKDNAQKF